MPIAIGDIHGCLNELERLVGMLPPTQELVFLGDYVDRGPQSAGVISYLEQLGRTRSCVMLRGNHEAMMNAAIKDTDQASFWFVNGGEATLDSFGQRAYQWQRLSPAEREIPLFTRFYDTLCLYHEDDTAMYVHAGIDIRIPTLAKQDPQVLMWVRERFIGQASQWRGKPIFFGHTPTRSLKLLPGEVFRAGKVFGIDTGCVYGGHLTAMDTVTHQRYQVQGPAHWSF